MQELSQPTVHIGTSSWLFDAWRGVFYPDGVPKNQYLPYYASQFDTVEVNTSFYAIPSPSTLINWVESVPAGFTYVLKFPRAITHDRRLVDCTDLTRTFLDALRALGPAAGPAFLQFPPDFTRRVNRRDLAAYLDWLAPEAPDLSLAVEVRAADLMTASFARFLAERNFALVLVDRIGTADLYDTWLECVDAGLGPDFALIRWIGDDRNGPQGDRELQVLRDADLARWADRIAELTGRGRTVYGYMHNPYEGHSPASVRRLRELLTGRVSLPDWPPDGAEGQLSLF
ncbi:MAG: DUF72 domain-containing protein [Caldilinea sp.]|nr:DUF72 domain-containing protein [Caldilineaceae bacterium]MCB9120265.1 DUF72 domain-containing protein [Caldilineaceae bacterium]MCB9124097.1 DUF72 domain-containing protein [Caldilineaceae bacterium]MCW5840717.1 DUF72 domain-containing protein [Caldilinea sp.]